MKMSFRDHRSVRKVQVAGSWPFRLDKNVFILWHILNWVLGCYFYHLFFFPFCSPFFIVLAEGLKHFWNFDVATFSYIVALYIEEWHSFWCRIFLMKLYFHIFFISAIIFFIFWSCMSIIVPYTRNLFWFTYSLYYFTPPYFCMYYCLRTLLLHFTYLSPTCLSKLNSCHFFPENFLDSHYVLSHSIQYIPLLFLKPIFAEHLLRAKHWVKHVISINSFNLPDNLKL